MGIGLCCGVMPAERRIARSRGVGCSAYANPSSWEVGSGRLPNVLPERLGCCARLFGAAFVHCSLVRPGSEGNRHGSPRLATRDWSVAATRAAETDTSPLVRAR